MEAALMTVDMMSTGFHVVDGAEIEFGDVVVVMGIGPVGLMAVAGAVLAGASRILAIGTRPNCVEVAKSYGATDIVSYKDGDTVEQILELTGGGADDRTGLRSFGLVNQMISPIRLTCVYTNPCVSIVSRMAQASSL